MKVVVIFLILGTVTFGAENNSENVVLEEHTNSTPTQMGNIGYKGSNLKSDVSKTQILSRTKRQYPYYRYPVIVPIFFGGGFGGYGYGFGGRGFGGRGFGGRGFGGRGGGRGRG